MHKGLWKRCYLSKISFNEHLSVPRALGQHTRSITDLAAPLAILHGTELVLLPLGARMQAQPVCQELRLRFLLSGQRENMLALCPIVCLPLQQTSAG